MRIGLAQINSAVGDISGNVEKIMAFCTEAARLGVHVVVFPEMAVCGYPPEDLLLKKHFLADNRAAVDAIAKGCPDIAVIVGFAEAADDGYFNALAVIEKSSVKTIYRKIILPNYGVFDERRYFRPGRRSTTAALHGHVVVPTICEDIWHVEWIDKFIGEMARRDLIVNISASPFHVGKLGERKEMLRRCATHFNCPVAYCNLVGGQDELVFDGRSMFADAQGAIVCQGKAFEEDLLVADVDPPGGKIRPVNADSALMKPASKSDRVGEVYHALVLGTRDYVRKNGFGKVVIGMSGGIDSALTAVIAADAVGPQNVTGVTMPTKFNSVGTIRDAGKVAENLGIKFHTIAIGSVLDQFAGLLKPVASSSQAGIAYENLQARIRGTIMMYLSNDWSAMVLTTSNKSETAVGYATLYGDTAGGFAVIKDVPKTLVYDLARFANKTHGRTVIPASVFNRAPSAELREGQKDSDSLPEYDLLDRILKGYIEDDKSAKELEEEGLPADVVRKVTRLVDSNEYKRRQSPPGVKITPRAFGKDRRMPITNRYAPK